MDEPEKVHTVIVEPAAGERGIVKRDVGMYRCPRCDTVFPRVISRRRYLLVPETEFIGLKKEVLSLTEKRDGLEKEAETMKRDFSERESALMKAKEKAEIEGKESLIRQLEAHVDYLRAQKTELERAVSH